MTHRIVVNVETGEVTQVEYTPEEQAIHDAAVAAQQADAAATPAPTEPAPVAETPTEPAPVAETPTEP
jgi:hypothetical protein